MALTRRNLLGGTVGTCAVACALPACGFDVNSAPERAVSADDKGQISFSLTQATELVPVGGALILSVTAPSKIATGVPPGGILVVHTEAAQFVAVAALCTHKGCALGYSAADKQIACPCHGSRFAANIDVEQKGCGVGAVLRGPAAEPLRAFDASYDAKTGLVTVDLTSAPRHCVGDTPPVMDNKVVLPLSTVPELTMVGGSWVGQPPGLADRLIVVRVDQSTVVALSSVCTHQGCTVGYETWPPPASPVPATARPTISTARSPVGPRPCRSRSTPPRSIPKPLRSPLPEHSLGDVAEARLAERARLRASLECALRRASYNRNNCVGGAVS